MAKTGKKIVQKGLVVASGGNISAKSNGCMFIKAKGTGLDDRKPSCYVCVDLKTGKSRKGIPSSEKYMHMACYKARPGVKAVVHIHPVFATAVANSRVPLKAVSYELLACLGSEMVRAKYKPSGSRALAREIGSKIKKYNAVLMPNHGILVVADTLDTAFKRAEAVERACMTLIFSRLMGVTKFLPRKEAARIIKLYS